MTKMMTKNLISVIILLYYIQSISCYMYFDVRKYPDNITIQEIIPPFMNLENYEPYVGLESRCDNFDDQMYGSERLTINILNIQRNTHKLLNYETNYYGNACLYKFKLVKEHCIYNDTNTTGFVLEPFIFSIKNNNNPTLSDCHNLLMNPRMIYNIKNSRTFSFALGSIHANNEIFNKDYYNNQLDYQGNNFWVRKMTTKIVSDGRFIGYHNEPSLKDFLRRYFEYNQKIASTDANYIKKLTDNKEQIEKELGLFTKEIDKELDSFTIDLEKHNYMYFYVLKINGIWCLRFGLTERDLLQTFTRQLFIEHFTKNIDTFRLLAIYDYDYESTTIAENTEQIIKEGLKSFILEEKQLGYSFFKSWDVLKTYITNGMMFSKSWIRPDLENEIKKIQKNP